MVKCFLHVSKDGPARAAAGPVGRPDQVLEVQPGDVDERGHWDEYQQAYADALRRCNTARRAVVRHPGGPEVVPELGGRRAAARRSWTRWIRTTRPPTSTSRWSGVGSGELTRRAAAAGRRRTGGDNGPVTSGSSRPWTVIVPVKASARAKSRIRLDPAMRRALALIMAQDTVSAVASAGPVGRTLVVVEDPGDGASLARMPGVEVFLTHTDELNAAIRDGLAALGPGATVRSRCCPPISRR